MKLLLFNAILFAFVGTVLVTLLGIAGVLPVPERYLDKLIVAVLIEAAAALIALFRSTEFFGPQAEVAAAGRKLEGLWWEMAYNHPDVAVSCVTMRYASERGRLEMTGEAFNHQGKRMATWSSRGASLQSSDHIEVVYFWKGDEALKTSRFTGVGWLEFASPAGKEKAASGSGWFSLGDIEGGSVVASCKVEMRRVSPGEAEVMSGADDTAREKAAAAAYARWRGSQAQPATTGAE